MRNQNGLTEDQIERAKQIWEFITGSKPNDHTTMSASTLSGLVLQLDTSNAIRSGSQTKFIEGKYLVRLGADVLPGNNQDSANSRMSPLACLCHEFSHAHRYHIGFRRPIEGCDMNLDEAETSLHASYIPGLAPADRLDLIEDAEERIDAWKVGGTK